MRAGGRKKVTLGRISGLFGVQGWIKVHSYTEPRENIVNFRAWILNHGGKEHSIGVEAGRRQGESVIAKLEGIDDREEARRWIGAEICVERRELPPPAPGEYYWTDLEGLEVRNTRGERLGEVEYLMATGGNDVIVLRGGDRLIPFVGGVVQQVDVESGLIIVDWEAGYWDR